MDKLVSISYVSAHDSCRQLLHSSSIPALALHGLESGRSWTDRSRVRVEWAYLWSPAERIRSTSGPRLKLCRVPICTSACSPAYRPRRSSNCQARATPTASLFSDTPPQTSPVLILNLSRPSPQDALEPRGAWTVRHRHFKYATSSVPPGSTASFSHAKEGQGCGEGLEMSRLPSRACASSSEQRIPDHRTGESSLQRDAATSSPLMLKCIALRLVRGRRPGQRGPRCHI
jgi:hypothetical protein